MYAPESPMSSCRLSKIGGTSALGSAILAQDMAFRYPQSAAYLASSSAYSNHVLSRPGFAVGANVLWGPGSAEWLPVSKITVVNTDNVHLYGPGYGFYWGYIPGTGPIRMFRPDNTFGNMLADCKGIFW